jgi:hypothetical protein
VLSTSLKQSFEKWRSGIFFEKYWVKNPKKKSHVDNHFQNPDSKSMSKLGLCSLVIGPHSLDVILYSVKPPAITFTPTVTQNSYPVSGNAYQHSPFPAQQSYSQPNIPAYPPAAIQPQTPAAHPPNIRPGPTSLPPDQKPAVSAPVPQATQNQQSQWQASAPPPQRQNPVTTPAQPPPATVNQPSGSTPQTHDAIASTNPVIQMLAQRASADPNLKALMKIVANGNANELQLKDFQRHIDELNAIIKSRANGASTSTTPQNRPPQAAPPPPPNAANTSPSPNTFQHTPWVPPTTPIKQENPPHYYSQPSSFQKPKPPVAPKPEIAAVVFEILSGTGDRYFIPKKSIVEYCENNRQVVIAFLVTMKGSEANGGTYKDDAEYYELIIMTLNCTNTKVLEPIRRAIDPPDKVRKYMEEIASKMSVAERAYLMLRLPRTADSIQNDKQNTAPEVDEDVPQSFYEAPNSLFPLKQRSSRIR